LWNGEITPLVKEFADCFKLPLGFLESTHGMVVKQFVLVLGVDCFRDENPGPKEL
jgi:hypothetical protein